MARNPTSFRLSSDALAALELLCIEQGCSRTEVIEWMLLGQSSSKQRRSSGKLQSRQNARHHSMADTIVLTRAAHSLVVSGKADEENSELARTLLIHAATLIKRHNRARTGGGSIASVLDPHVLPPPNTPHPRLVATIIERINNHDHP
jgi:hypothetical protein|tara:strand:+ start:628 stop:1071 length:444 start_codon:yes stop_codon:yes gene_type:complete